jgi:hypothetical protein
MGVAYQYFLQISNHWMSFRIINKERASRPSRAKPDQPNEQIFPKLKGFPNLADEVGDESLR